MSDKLTRAKHTREAVQRRQVESAPRHARPSDTLPEVEPFEAEGRSTDDQAVSKELTDRTYVEIDSQDKDENYSVGKSAALISICTIISRITGFARTWAMAAALGVAGIASAYNVAYNVPFMLSEIVAGGMIATAFLPVYISVKKKLGKNASNAYASNLLTLVIILLGIVTVLSLCFPSFIIWTQSFLTPQENMGQAVFFFQFFAIQIVFYGISAILSGLLNANRDYLWYSIAPIFTNLIVIGSFILFAVLYPTQPEVALYVIAIANPAGVFIQIIIQMPALKKHGIKLRPRVDLRDPALKDTLRLGVPAVVVVLCSFAIVSVQQAAALSFTESGPSIIYYARLWFALPYSFLAIPIATAMFTELSNMQTEGDIDGFKRGVISGTNQILFFMIPFALYLIVYSTPLITLYHAGNFTADDIPVVAGYLATLAVALPFYGVNTYMERVFASMRKMGIFGIFNVVAALVQIGLTLAFTTPLFPSATIQTVALATAAFYIIADICLFIYLKIKLHPFKIQSLAITFVRSLVLGVLGAGLGWLAFWGLESFVAPLSGSILQALGYIVACGLISLLATFGIALALKLPEASFLSSLLSKATSKLRR